MKSPETPERTRKFHASDCGIYTIVDAPASFPAAHYGYFLPIVH
jgi:hypothetical protein